MYFGQVHMTRVRILVFTILFSLSFCSYQPSLALKMSKMSLIAYQNPIDILYWNCSSCGQFQPQIIYVIQNQYNGIQVFCGYFNDLGTIVVSFRGSSNIQNWISNLDATMIDYPKCQGCQVHKGFSQLYEIVKVTIQTCLQQMQQMYGDKSIFITGHSLGGALATLCTADLWDKYKIPPIYTFGQPRIGNSKFSQYFDQNILEFYRLVHYGDLVPHLPPSSFEFLHSSFEVWYSQDMKSYKICHNQEGQQSSSCSNSLPDTSLSFTDHSISYYIQINNSISSLEQRKTVSFQPNNLQTQ